MEGSRRRRYGCFLVEGPRIAATGTIRYRYAYRTQYRDAKLASAQRKESSARAPGLVFRSEKEPARDRVHFCCHNLTDSTPLSGQLKP